jgi:hypothetical protein
VITKNWLFLPPAVKKNQRPGLSVSVTSWFPLNVPEVTVTAYKCRASTKNTADFDSSSPENV